MAIGARPSDEECAADPGSGSVDLVRRAVAGEAEAVRDLWKEHRRWVAAILLAHKPCDADLEDLLQEVALTFVKQVRTLNDASAFRPWLRTVARHAALNAGRKRQRRLRLVQPIAEAPASQAPDPAEGAAIREQAEEALQAVQRLDPKYAEPLLLRCAHRLSYQQIAAALDVPVTTVETRIARARRLLRDELGQRRIGGVACGAG